jgi:hypothetical protein
MVAVTWYFTWAIRAGRWQVADREHRTLLTGKEPPAPGVPGQGFGED